MLKPQDLLVVLRLALLADGENVTFQALSIELGMSASEVHASVKRAADGTLINNGTRQVNKTNLLEFLLHGARVVFPAKRGGLTRGIPTSYAAPPLNKHFAQAEAPPVWSHPAGTVRGEELSPLYRSAPEAALKSPSLYELLALVDALRAGRARERSMAAKALTQRLS